MTYRIIIRATSRYHKDTFHYWLGPRLKHYPDPDDLTLAEYWLEPWEIGQLSGGN